MNVHRTQFGFAVAILLAIIAGIQVYEFGLKMSDPFYYHSIRILTPQIKRCASFAEELDVERFRSCQTTVDRYMINDETKEVFLRERIPSGATGIGRTKGIINKMKIACDAPIGKATLIQVTNSHCIEGMHSIPWPIIKFEIME